MLHLAAYDKMSEQMRLDETYVLSRVRARCMTAEKHPGSAISRRLEKVGSQGSATLHPHGSREGDRRAAGQAPKIPLLVLDRKAESTCQIAIVHTKYRVSITVLKISVLVWCLTMRYFDLARDILVVSVH